jgi:hypothetical protein
MQHSRLIAAALAAAFSASIDGAFAQAPAPAEGGSMMKMDPAKRDEMIEQRFKAANKSGDGKLTKEEAEAGMPRVAKHFDEIDADHKGYVTLDQVKAAAARMRGGH